MTQKKFPTWATDNLVDIGNGDPSITDPGSVKQALGWVVEKPLLQTMNWLLNLYGHFIKANNKVAEVLTTYETEAGERVEVDNSTAIAIVKLPTTPIDGQWVEISPLGLTSLFMITVDGGSKDIMIAADKLCNLNIDNVVFKFWWKASVSMWKIRMVNSVGRV